MTDTPTPAGTIPTPIPTTISVECRIYTVPCEWLGLLFIGVVVVSLIGKITIEWWHSRQIRKPEPETKIPEPSAQEITVVTRGGITSRGLEPKNLEIHVDVEAGIEHPDKKDEKGG